MNDLLAAVVTALNAAADGLGRWLLAPIGWLPGWLSASLVAAATGLGMLLAFKYTSNQRAVRRARDDIKAHLLALKLFKDSASVALACQGRVFWGAARLFLLALVPMAAMTVPMCLLLGQLALWYQARPLRVGEEAVITLTWSAAAANAPAKTPVQAALVPDAALELVAGPVRIASAQQVCWNVRARRAGPQRLQFQVGATTVDKELAVGDGFQRVSLARPPRTWTAALLHPAEQPFDADSAVQSIAVAYPRRSGWTCGSDSWLVYWFLASMVWALVFRPWLNVNL